MLTKYCDFCGKGAGEVAKLIDGPTANICDECVVLCNGVLAPDFKPGALVLHFRETDHG